ncbi:hypothetical protein AAZX31_19G033000 [Glycine max]
MDITVEDVIPLSIVRLDAPSTWNIPEDNMSSSSSSSCSFSFRCEIEPVSIQADTDDQDQ